ncbi:MAG: hypothetical protein IPM21_02220 [Acidobacteria bacterium]|nr:hypothetical protein [Acidobacteriota bacterium]
MPENVSQLTQLRSIPETIGAGTEAPTGKRRFVYAAGGLGALLLAGVIVAGVVSYSEFSVPEVPVSEPGQTALPLTANIANAVGSNQVEGSGESDRRQANTAEDEHAARADAEGNVPGAQ